MNNLNLPVWFIALYIFIIGACAGSFLNVFVLRGLSGEDFIRSRSKCPKCNNKLKWYMNIPIFSFIFLGGKCAFCKEKISWQYPIVECLLALLFLSSYLTFGLSLKALFLCIFFFFFVSLCVSDYLEQVIIDYHAYILAAIGFIASLFNLFQINWYQAIIGALFGFLFFEGVSRIGLKLLNHRFFGEGDSIIALALGTIFGFKTLLILVPLSFLIQTLIAIPYLSIQAFQEKKINLAISYFIVIVSIFSCFIVNYLNLIKNNNHYLIFALAISLCLLFSLRNILLELKYKKEQNEINQEENMFCLMPFGPALIYASIICIFWINEIKLAIKNCLY